MTKHIKTQTHRPDFFLLITIIGLTLFGLLMVYNASPVTSLRDFGDPLYLVRFQTAWAFLGFVLGVIIYKIPYSFWQKIAPLLFVFGLTLLLAVFIPKLGAEVYGAQRWIRVGTVGIQPAEFAKLAYIIYLASFLSKKVKLGPFLLVTGLLAIIVLVQKDLGTTLITTMIGFSMYFVAGGVIWQLILLVPVLASVTTLLVITSPYRKARLLAFLNPSLDPEGISYHISQALIALGSGGFFGVGLGESRQKYGFIPEVTTDSIFAVIGNELGFFGSLLLIITFLIIIYRGFRIALSAPDKFSLLVATGITVWISIQAFINIGGLSALLPLTGVPLPFVSYGGSSLVSTMLGIAILLNISKHTKTRSN